MEYTQSSFRWMEAWITSHTAMPTSLYQLNPINFSSSISIQNICPNKQQMQNIRLESRQLFAYCLSILNCFSFVCVCVNVVVDVFVVYRVLVLFQWLWHLHFHSHSAHIAYSSRLISKLDEAFRFMSCARLLDTSKNASYTHLVCLTNLLTFDDVDFGVEFSPASSVCQPSSSAWQKSSI